MLLVGLSWCVLNSISSQNVAALGASGDGMEWIGVLTISSESSGMRVTASSAIFCDGLVGTSFIFFLEEVLLRHAMEGVKKWWVPVGKN